MALYSLSRTDGDDSKPYFTRLIADATTGLHDKWTAQNDLHVRMIEQAGEDRVLFLNTKPQEHVEMKFPEYVLSWHIGEYAMLGTNGVGHKNTGFMIVKRGKC